MSDASRPTLRRLAFAALCAAAFASSSRADEPAIRLSPGRLRTVTLPENPSTGYTWAIDRAASRGLGAIAISDGGHKRGRAAPGGPPGAPGERLWTIRALAPGHAEIVFVYRRPWEPAPAETRRVAVDVAP